MMLANFLSKNRYGHEKPMLLLLLLFLFFFFGRRRRRRCCCCCCCCCCCFNICSMHGAKYSFRNRIVAYPANKFLPLWSMQVYHLILKSLSMILVFSHLNPIHNGTSYFCKTIWAGIPSTPTSPNCLSFSHFPNVTV